MKIMNIQFVHNLEQLDRCIFPGRVCYPDGWGDWGCLSFQNQISLVTSESGFKNIWEWSLRDSPINSPQLCQAMFPLPTSIDLAFTWEISKWPRSVNPLDSKCDDWLRAKTKQPISSLGGWVWRGNTQPLLLVFFCLGPCLPMLNSY